MPEYGIDAIFALYFRREDIICLYDTNGER